MVPEHALYRLVCDASTLSPGAISRLVAGHVLAIGAKAQQCLLATAEISAGSPQERRSIGYPSLLRPCLQQMNPMRWLNSNPRWFPSEMAFSRTTADPC